MNIDHLDGKMKGDIGFKVTPSRRSWEAVIRVMEASERGIDMGDGKSVQYNKDAVHGVIGGLVGQEMALQFANYNCPVTPRELIENGIDKYRDQLSRLSAGQATSVMWGMVSHLKGKLTDNEKLSNVACDFAEYMATSKHKDTAVAFVNLLIDTQDASMRSALIVNVKLAQMVAKSGKKNFLHYLNARPKLQQLISDTSYGK